MPAINREEVEARLAELRESKERLSADLSATVGAIQTCEFFLAQLDRPAETSIERVVRKLAGKKRK